MFVWHCNCYNSDSPPGDMEAQRHQQEHPSIIPSSQYLAAPLCESPGVTAHFIWQTRRLYNSHWQFHSPWNGQRSCQHRLTWANWAPCCLSVNSQSSAKGRSSDLKTVILRVTEAFWRMLATYLLPLSNFWFTR